MEYSATETTITVYLKPNESFFVLANYHNPVEYECETECGITKVVRMSVHISFKDAWLIYKDLVPGLIPEEIKEVIDKYFKMSETL